ncbi:hypothetical protein BFJ71_g16734, partial [Fusarium oxysporum]
DERIQTLIARREMDGYTIIRHRTVTGEVTASITREPFTPTLVHHPLRDGFTQSNFSTDLQILDRDLALMDLTYANAWQLGKSLAMGDAAFSAALARLRNSIHSQALAAAKKEVHSGLGGFRSRAETAAGMLDLAQGFNRLSKSHRSEADGQAQDYISLSRLSTHRSSRLPCCADVVTARCSMASDGQLYNEYNIPDSSDYAHVYSWVLDKLHLSDIPTHYYILYPSYLPEETMRFFHVDENWTDAVIDGALSLSVPNQRVLTTAALPSTGAHSRPDTMYCLFDTAPPGLTHIIFTLPLHQQRFVVDQTLTETQLTVMYREISTDPTYEPRDPAQVLGSVDFTKDDTNLDSVFKWGQWTMNVGNYGQEIVKELRNPERMMKDGKYLFKD